MMKPATRENLERLILRIDAMLAGMHAGIGKQPDYFNSEATPGSDRREAYWAWDKQRKAALDHISLTLEAEESARFSKISDSDQVVIAGVRSSCTSGLEGLFRNWQNAARRRIEKETPA